MSARSQQQPPRYSILVEWSELDQAYIVTLPEWEQAGTTAHTHGASYAEAAHKGEELLSFLIDSARQAADPMPQPATYDAHAYAPGETAESLAAQNETLAREIEAHHAAGS